MKVLLRKMYLDEYDLKPIVKAVHNLFDDYNYKKTISKGYYDESLKHLLSYKPEDSRHKKKSDSTLKAVENKEKVDKYLKQFDKKLEYLLETFTDDELKVFKYCVLARVQDKEIRDRICKTDKTFYPNKKSCYVKLALGFDLVDGFTKNVFATISLLN